MLINNSWISEKKDTFYSPISKYAYLTPLQRKKLREKRKLDFSSPENDKEAEKSVKKFKKMKSKLCTKPYYKAKKIEPINKKSNKLSTPEIRCSAAQVLTQNNSLASENKKFFKSRSPEHLKKMNFVVPLSFKKSRLDFADHKNSDVANSKKISQSYLSLEPSEESKNKTSVESLNSPLTVNPLIIKVIAIEEKVETISISEQGTSDKSGAVSSHEVVQNFQTLEVCSEVEGSSVIDGNKISSEQVIPAIKLYPIFDLKTARKVEPNKKISSVKKSFYTKDKSKGSEQLIIDAGQKEIGAKECQVCGMPYTIGHAEDERIHSQYHENYLLDLKQGLRYPGWEKENQIGSYDDGVVIKLTERHFKLKKFLDVLTLADRDLGIPNTELPVKPNVISLLFISKNGRVRGCLVAESITSASPITLHRGTWCASSESVDAICGINRIWVAKEYRKHKVASRMVDCLRCNFIFGYVINMKDLAFTSPTLDGREFAASYTGIDNFLVYT